MSCHISRIVLAFSTVLFALGIPQAEAEEPFDTVASYTEALRLGDTIGIKSYIGGRLYEKKEVLLDQNAEYPDFLRNFYQGALFRVSDEMIDLGPRGQGIEVEISFPAGHISKSMAIVEQAPDGLWRIVDEVEAIP